MVVRFYGGDSLSHYYVGADVADLGARSAVTPACELEQFYPQRHDPGLIGRRDLPKSGFVDGCSGCAVWARRNRHTMLLRGAAPRLAPAGPHRAIR